MENKRLQLLQHFIGKPFSGSPSPFAKWLNGTVIAADKNSVEFQFMVRKEMTNPAGTLHGGVICGMFDDCIGVNFMILDTENFFPTINLNVEFFSAVKEGDTVTVKTNVAKRGKSVINIKADMFSSKKKYSLSNFKSCNKRNENCTVSILQLTLGFVYDTIKKKRESKKNSIIHFDSRSVSLSAALS